jgi:GPH family glycoside/pentoside/hexuronide:cation symporter
MLALASLKIFADPVTGEPDLVNGVRYISVIAGLMVMVVGVLPGLFVKERYYAKETSKQVKIGLFKSLKMTLSSRPFQYLMAAYLLNFIGMLLTVSLGQYLCIYYVCGGDIQQAGVIQGLRGTLMFGAGILGIPFWTWVAQKIGKKKTLGLTIIMGYARSVLIRVCYTPEHPYLMIVPEIFMAAFGSALWMLVPSMVADIADYDELHTGERREGSFSSVSSWLLKLSGTLTVGLSGLILVKTGFDVVKYGGSQPPEVLQRMMNFHVFLPAVFWTIALVCLIRYSLTHQMMLDIREKLEARRGKI